MYRLIVGNFVLFSMFASQAFAGCLDQTTDPHVEYVYEASQNHLTEKQACAPNTMVSTASCQCFTLGPEEANHALAQQPNRPVMIGVFTAPNFSFSGLCDSGLQACNSVCAMLAQDAECAPYRHGGLN